MHHCWGNLIIKCELTLLRSKLFLYFLSPVSFNNWERMIWVGEQLEWRHEKISTRKTYRERSSTVLLTGVGHSVSTVRLGWFCSLGFNGTVLVNSRTISCRQQGARSSQAVNKRQIFLGVGWGMNNRYFYWELLTLFFPALEESPTPLLMR